MKMEQFNLIITKPVEELLEGQKEFLNIHNSIIYYGTNVCVNLYQMAKQLELMKESKAYKDAGFESFESYAEDCLGLKRSQVYNYIKVANSYSNEFLLNNSKIGVTKLLVLSELEEPVVEKIIETVEVEDTNVSELKEMVKSLKGEVDDHKQKLKDEKDKHKKQIEKLKNEIDVLKDLQEQEVESSKTVPVDNPELLQRIDSLQKELANKEKELIIKQEELVKMESNSKSNVINSNPDLIKFKVIYNDIQLKIRDLKNLIDGLDEESSLKCKNALNHVLRGAIYE